MISVPRRHAYVRNIAWAGDGVERIETPAQAVRSSDVIDPAWVREHAGAFDVAHTHFGITDVDLATLRAWRDELRAAGKPLVHTVHDLDNPHFADQDHHFAQLDLLVAEADGLITLTGCAADEVERRWGRRPVVLAHPHIVALDRIGARREARRPRIVGVHLKDLRAAIHAPELVEVLAEVVAADERFRLRVDVYPPAVERQPAVGERLRRLAETAAVDLRLRPYGPDDDFDAYVREIDVSLLPYRWGTHSGWAEACLDVGTKVLAPVGTCIPDQHASIVGVDLHAEDLAAELRRGLDEVAAQDDRLPWSREGRAEQRRAIATAHAELYRSLVG